MNLMHVLIASTAAFLILGSGAAKAKQTINEAGAISCVNDKWDVKEPEKGHKLVDYAGRCVNVPDDAAAPKSTADCASTSTCLMEVGRAAGPALTPIKAGTR
jgi:hypothetical protein